MDTNDNFHLKFDNHNCQTKTYQYVYIMDAKKKVIFKVVITKNSLDKQDEVENILTSIEQIKK